MSKQETKRILAGIMGSQSVGTATEESDYDTMEVVLGHEDCYIGMDWWGEQGTREFHSAEGETTQYELRKFLRLCQNFNPNVIPLLWLREEDYFVKLPAGQRLLTERDMFSSKRAYHTFAGYAHGQLQKMGEPGASTGRMGEKRKALREKYGYDTKYAYHAIRLGKMLNEFLEDGVLRVYRPRDKEFLLSIRNGAFSYEEILARSEALLEEAKAHVQRSPLPDEPDKERIRRVCREILREHLAL